MSPAKRRADFGVANSAARQRLHELPRHGEVDLRSQDDRHRDADDNATRIDDGPAGIALMNAAVDLELGDDAARVFAQRGHR